MISSKAVYTEESEATTETDPRFTKYSTPNSESAAPIDEVGGFTPLPDVLLDQFLADLSGSETKVIMYVARRTYGFQKQHDEISVSQMAEGITKRDGAILDRGTGLSRQAVITAVGKLMDKGLLMKVRNYDPRRGDTANTYRMTLPKPCHTEETSSTPPVSKNYTPRVQKLYPQDRVGQEIEFPPHASADSNRTRDQREAHPDADNDIPTTDQLSADGLARDAGGRLRRRIEDAGGSILNSLAGQYGRSLKRLANEEEATSDELEQVADLIATDWPKQTWAADALNGIRNGGRKGAQRSHADAHGSASASEGPTTPQAALDAIRADQKLSRYMSVAKMWDFTSEEDPPDRVAAKLGGTWDERNSNLKRMRVISRRAVEASGRPESTGETETEPQESDESWYREGYGWFFDK